MLFRYILYILIAGVIIYMILGLLKPRRIMNSSNPSIDNSIKSYDKINYLGGITSVDIDKKVEGTLHIYKDIIVFDDGSSELFNISIRNISRCSLETSESLFSSRDDLKGVIITDIEKNKRYIKIKYKDSYNNWIIVILQSYFNDDYSTSIVGEVNKRIR